MIGSDDPGAATSAAGCPVLAGYDPLAAAEIANPFPSFARARREAPVFYDEMRGFWSVARREDVIAAMHDTERFSNRMAIPMPVPPERLRNRMPRYPFATALLFMDDPEHGVARQMIDAPFAPERLRRLEPLARARTEQLLRLGDPDRRIEFVGEYATPLALAVTGAMVGVPERDFPLVERATYGALRMASGLATAGEADELADGQLEYWEYLCALVEERRMRPQDDFISALVAYTKKDGSEPTTEEVAGHVNTVLPPAFEAAQLLSLGVLAILEHRDQWERLKSNPNLLANAVEECARYRAVNKRNYRVAKCDLEIAGVTIPKGSLVALMVASANRDESACPDPDRFDITRTAENITFGSGAHRCPGAPLSRLELRLTLESLLRYAPDAHLVEHEEPVFKDDLRHIALERLVVDLGVP